MEVNEADENVDKGEGVQIGGRKPMTASARRNRVSTMPPPKRKLKKKNTSTHDQGTSVSGEDDTSNAHNEDKGEKREEDEDNYPSDISEDDGSRVGPVDTSLLDSFQEHVAYNIRLGKVCKLISF